MNLLWLLVIILVAFAILGAPGVGSIHHDFGYYPSTLLVVIVIFLLVLLLR